MMVLYDHPLSGHAHRTRLFLAILNLPYERINVDLSQGEHRQNAFLELNPLGQVPVLIDNKLTLRDSIAILTYLALKYDSRRTWLPQDPARAAQVQQWLATSVKELALGPAAARAAKVFGRKVDHPRLVEKSHALLGTLFEPHLSANNWLVGDQPTIADLANYSYIAVADEGHVLLDHYPHIRQWLTRIEALDGFEAMPGAKR